MGERDLAAREKFWTEDRMTRAAVGRLQGENSYPAHFRALTRNIRTAALRLLARYYRWQADRSVAAQLMTPVERMRVVYWRMLAYRQIDLQVALGSAASNGVPQTHSTSRGR